MDIFVVDGSEKVSEWLSHRYICWRPRSASALIRRFLARSLSTVPFPGSQTRNINRLDGNPSRGQRWTRCVALCETNTIIRYESNIQRCGNVSPWHSVMRHHNLMRIWRAGPSSARRCSATRETRTHCDQRWFACSLFRLFTRSSCVCELVCLCDPADPAVRFARLCGECGFGQRN